MARFPGSLRAVSELAAMRPAHGPLCARPTSARDLDGCRRPSQFPCLSHGHNPLNALEPKALRRHRDIVVGLTSPALPLEALLVAGSAVH